MLHFLVSIFMTDIKVPERLPLSRRSKKRCYGCQGWSQSKIHPACHQQASAAGDITTIFLVRHLHITDSEMTPHLVKKSKVSWSSFIVVKRLSDRESRPVTCILLWFKTMFFSFLEQKISCRYWPHVDPDEPPNRGRNKLYSTERTL